MRIYRCLVKNMLFPRPAAPLRSYCSLALTLPLRAQHSKVKGRACNCLIYATIAAHPKHTAETKASRCTQR